MNCFLVDLEVAVGSQNFTLLEIVVVCPPWAQNEPENFFGFAKLPAHIRKKEGQVERKRGNKKIISHEVSVQVAVMPQVHNCCICASA